MRRRTSATMIISPTTDETAGSFRLPISDDIDKDHHRRDEKDHAVLEPGKDTVGTELARHDAGKEGEDEADPEHLGQVSCRVDSQVHSLEAGEERDIQLVCRVQVDTEREVD